jgi:putative nucleotidyltransferase with HDIG domain
MKLNQNNFLWPLTAILIPYFIFEILHSGLVKDIFFILPRGHFYIVSLVSILASIISIAIGIAGRRIRNIKISFLSLSFLSIGLMFSVHGLSTPNFMIGMTHLPGIAAQLSMLLGTIWLWFSSLSSDNLLVDFFAKRQKFLLPAWTVALIAFGVITLLDPSLMDHVTLNIEPINIILTLIIGCLNGITIYRNYQSYRYSKFPLQLAIVYSSGWIIVSQIIMVRGIMWSLSWWIYHFLLLLSMIVMVIGLVNQYAVKGALSESIFSLFTNDPFERITNSISPSVKALVTATEKKDTYTAGHTFRVTFYALNLAKELNLKPEELRAIVQGGLVHDVGKIRIPEHVLNKPGKLLDNERALIEEHPVLGYDMCKNLGFMKEELSIVRSHHERWDGRGYPDKLKGNDIPFYARIVAVADVYDALTSERAYRKAWTHTKAMDYLKENKGTHFDPLCVDKWEELCSRNPNIYQYPLQATKNEEAIQKLASV